MTYIEKTKKILTEQLLLLTNINITSADDDLIDLYALLVLTKGKKTKLEDVHDAWAIWRQNTKPDHPSIIPFAQLDRSEQELDRPFMLAIHKASDFLGSHR